MNKLIVSIANFRVQISLADAQLEFTLALCLNSKYTLPMKIMIFLSLLIYLTASSCYCICSTHRINSTEKMTLVAAFVTAPEGKEAAPCYEICP